MALFTVASPVPIRVPGPVSGHLFDGQEGRERLGSTTGPSSLPSPSSLGSWLWWVETFHFQSPFSCLFSGSPHNKPFHRGMPDCPSPFTDQATEAKAVQ